MSRRNIQPVQKSGGFRTLKSKRFQDLDTGDIFIFPGDRMGSADETGFVKLDDRRYSKISDVRNNREDLPFFKIKPGIQVFPVGGLAPVSLN